jgi:hypothetical protein
MGKRLLVVAFAMVFAAGLGLASDDNKDKDRAMIGWVTDTHCGAKPAASGKHGDCAKKCVDGGAKYALYTPADKKVYVLEPQEKAADFAGKHVKVKGTVDGETLNVASIELTGEQKGGEQEKEKEKKTKEKTTS